MIVVNLSVTFLGNSLYSVNFFLDRSAESVFLGEEINVETAFELTSDIVFLELIHRVVVCIFEAICTFKGPLGKQE